MPRQFDRRALTRPRLMLLTSALLTALLLVRASPAGLNVVAAAE